MLNFFVLFQTLSVRTTELVSQRVNNDRGATAVEYGLMVTLIAVAIIGAVFTLGGNLSAIFNSVATRV